MSELSVILIPAVLATKQCHDYCGGQPVFVELLAKHGEILKPVRTTERGDCFYRRIDIDSALTQAQHQRTLINPTGERKLLERRKITRRFQPVSP